MRANYPVRTRDGSFTLYSAQYDEHFHSLRSGALDESLYKHAYPALTHHLASNPQKIRILDICFGLGYNVLATLYALDEMDFKGDVEIISPELNRELVASLTLLPYPPRLFPYLEILYQLATTLHYHSPNQHITIHIEDALHTIQKDHEPFDIIFQDAFSRKNNPELWTEAYFKRLHTLLHHGGIMTTYSQAKGVRKILAHSGFTLYEHNFERTSPIRPGTLALKDATLPLPEITLG